MFIVLHSVGKCLKRDWEGAKRLWLNVEKFRNFSLFYKGFLGMYSVKVFLPGEEPRLPSKFYRGF